MAWKYDKLITFLKENNIPFDTLRKQIQVSPNTISKIKNNQPVSLDIIDKICFEYNLMPQDILEYIPTELPYKIGDVFNPNDLLSEMQYQKKLDGLSQLSLFAITTIEQNKNNDDAYNIAKSMLDREIAIIINIDNFKNITYCELPRISTLFIPTFDESIEQALVDSILDDKKAGEMFTGSLSYDTFTCPMKNFIRHNVKVKCTFSNSTIDIIKTEIEEYNDFCEILENAKSE